jgi:hypothetical protein
MEFLQKMTVCQVLMEDPYYYTRENPPNYLNISGLLGNCNHWVTLLSRDSSVGISTRLRAGRSGFDSWQGHEIFLFSTASIAAMESTRPHIQWVPGALSSGLKRRGRETDHSPPSSAEVKNGWAVLPLPICLHGMVRNDIMKYRDKISSYRFEIIGYSVVIYATLY